MPSELSPIVRVLAAVTGFALLSVLVAIIWRRVRRSEGDDLADRLGKTTNLSDTWKAASGCLILCLSLAAGFCCLSSGPISAVWLMIKGEWWLLAGGVLAMVAVPLIYPLAMLPALPFMYGARHLLMKRKTWAAAVAALPGCAYQSFAGMIWATCVGVMAVNTRAETVIPAIIWGFNVAVAPLAFMMGRRQSPSDSSWIGVALATLAYWAVVLLNWFGAPATSIDLALVSLTVLATVLTVINFLAFAPDPPQTDADTIVSARRSATPPHRREVHTKPERQADPASVRDETSTAPAVEPWTRSADLLHDAAGRGDASEMRLLLAGGVPVDARDDMGATTLARAALGGHLEVVALLLAWGADADARSRSGGCALDNAALSGHEGVVSLLLERGADVDARGSEGFTPLHFAALNGHHAVAEALLQRGAGVNARGTTGLTPLHLAAMRGHLQVVGLLLERGAEFNREDSNGATPLRLALAAGHRETAELLMGWRGGQ